MSDAFYAHWRRMATFNRLANERQYAACAELADTDLRRERHAPFRSIWGLLNHLVVGDRIWMTRFEGGEIPSTHLDAQVALTLVELGAIRESLDERITRFMDALDDACLSCEIEYINNQGKRYRDPMPMLLGHFFNHQTYHRAQINSMLKETAVPPPNIDMHRILSPDPLS